MFASWKKRANARSTVLWADRSSSPTAAARVSREPVPRRTPRASKRILSTRSSSSFPSCSTSIRPSRLPSKRTFAPRARSPRERAAEAIGEFSRGLEVRDFQTRHRAEHPVPVLDDHLAADRELVARIGDLPVAREQERVGLVPVTVRGEERLTGRVRTSLLEELDERLGDADAVQVEVVAGVRLRQIASEHLAV